MPGTEKPRSFRISAHGIEEIRRRRLDPTELFLTVEFPEQVLQMRPGRVVHQRRFPDPGPTHLVRVFVDVDRDPPVVVTAYRTSKIGKYWSRQ